MAKKVPPTRFPNSVVVGYSRAIKKLVRQMGSETLRIFDERVPESLKELKRSDAIEERGDWNLDSIMNALLMITNAADAIFDVYVVTEIATENIRLLDRVSENNTAAQARVMAVNPLSNNDKLLSFMQASIQENVSYITKLKTDYKTEVERIVLQGAKKAQTAKEMRSEIVARTGMTQQRAEFIAIDQIGTLFGQITAERHQNMGLNKFAWSTSGDERVRDTHAALDGKVFSYTDPPTVNGRKVLPGEDFRCRCVAEPIFDD